VDYFQFLLKWPTFPEVNQWQIQTNSKGAQVISWPIVIHTHILRS